MTRHFFGVVALSLIAAAAGAAWGEERALGMPGSGDPASMSSSGVAAPALASDEAPAPWRVAQATPPPAPPPGGLSFDLMPEEQKGPTAEQLRLESQVDTRRSMLEWHQALGFATTGLLIGTVILGQLSYSDKFGGGGNSGKFEIWHSGVEALTVGSFAATGLLALFAPVPYEKKSNGIDTVTIHKYAMLLATIGMATEIPLGIYTVAREGYTDQATLALVHLVVGYVTAAAFGTAAGALFF